VLYSIRSAVIAGGIAVLVSCARSEERATFHLPESNTTVSVERTPTHAFLAEYQRRVIIETAGRPANRYELFPDSGGFSRTNLYQLDVQKALLRDADASYTIDLTTGMVSKDSERRKAGTFIGSFDVDESKTWRFIPARERTEFPTEFRGG
jgi:hypothetical protein